MISLALKEYKSFFGSAIGYLVITAYLLTNGLFLWLFEGEYNILKSGFADLAPFFKLSPYIFIFLIPIVTMKSFSEEKKTGTLEMLLTKPLHTSEVVLGKFLGAFLLLITAILPTLIYVFIMQQYSFPENNLDWGTILGSYIGLLFLISAYCAIGLYASTLTDSQMVACLLAIAICFIGYIGIQQLSLFSGSFTTIVAYFGLFSHYKSISRGVLDSRDLLYFLSISFVFLAATVFQLNNEKNR